MFNVTCLIKTDIDTVNKCKIVKTTDSMHSAWEKIS